MPQGPTRPPAEKGAILIVDDEPWSAEVIRVSLEGDGYLVEVVMDGQSGLQAVEQFNPDLVLLDVRLPDMDGYEVCRQIKQDPRRQFLPVILVTALRGFDERIRGLHAGADAILIKPLHQLELLARVQSLVRIKRLYDEVEVYRNYLEEQVAQRTVELEQALHKLQELNRLKSAFIGSVSHELRTPLSYLKGPLEMLADGTLGPLNQEQVDAVVMACRGMHQLEQLIGDILNFNRMQREPMSLEPIELAPLFDRIVELLAPVAAEAEVSIHVAARDDLPLVQANLQGVSAVLRHLIENAIKFSPSGSEVTVAATPTMDRRNVEVSVTDHGIGIPEDELDRIFEPFYQVDGSSTRAFRGTGIGLALARLVLEGLNSTIQVASKPGTGSRFYFVLPAVLSHNPE